METPVTFKNWTLPLGLVLSLTASQISAEEPESIYSPTVMGMGGAFRGVMGDAANLELNPGAMGLSSVYGGELNFGLQGDRGLGTGRLIVMDGKTRPGITAGFAVDWGWLPVDEAAPGWTVVGTETESVQNTAQARSFTFGMGIPVTQDGKAGFGFNLKVARLSETDEEDAQRDITGDVGIYLRPISQLAVGLVGNNLKPTDSDALPTTLGIGAALYVVPQLIVAVDGVMDFTSQETATGSFHLGIEGKTADIIPLRMGFYTAPSDTDGTMAKFLTAGVGVLSSPFQLAYSLRVDLSQLSSEESIYYHVIGISGGL